MPLELQLEINDWTHQNGVHFIAAENRGLFGYIDFPHLLDNNLT